MAVIKNADRLLSRLNNIANIDLKDTMVKATTIVHGQAKENANFQKGYQTGQLKGSIHMKVESKGKKCVGKVFTNNDHAVFVEFGTGMRGNGSYPYNIAGLKLEYKKAWSGMKAQPYMYPALKQHEKYIRQLFKKEVHTKLKQNCKGR